VVLIGAERKAYLIEKLAENILSVHLNEENQDYKN
jgi:hypothetical protein